MKDRALLGITHPPTSISQFEADLGYQFPVISSRYYTFASTWSTYVAELSPASGRTLHVCWMPQQMGAPVSMAELVRGRYDDHIDHMLAGMRAFPGSVICRWGHEANGSWSPWSAAYVHAPPTAIRDYVAAWRYVVERERARSGVSNIRWFWCPNARDVAASDGSVYPLESYWPGDDWVDLIGCDGYNEPQTWTPFAAVFADAYSRITALSARPFWIGEVGCHEPDPSHAGSKAGWIQEMLECRDFPAIEGVCYFDYDARDRGRADWRMNSTPQTWLELRRIFASLATSRH